MLTCSGTQYVLCTCRNCMFVPSWRSVEDDVYNIVISDQVSKSQGMPCSAQLTILKGSQP